MNYMSKIAKVEYYTTVKSVAINCVLASHSQHCYINSPAMAETNHAAPELADTKKVDLNHPPSPHLLPSGK